MPKIVFTPQVRQQIVSLIRAGNYLKAASASAGVSYRAVLGWMQRGKTEGEGEYFDFYKAVKKAEADFEQEAVANILASEQPKYILEILSRRNPSSWASTSRVSIQVKEKIENFLEFLAIKLEAEPEILKKVLTLATEYQDENEI